MSLHSNRANRIHAVATNGEKPLQERKVARLALAAVLVFTASFAGQSHAANWFSQSVDNSSANHYTSSQSLRAGNVNEGVIEAIQRVNIKDKAHRGTTTLIGGAIGGALGYTVTHNNHNYRVRSLGALLGTTLGAGVGSMAQNIGSGHPALRIIVRTTDGRGHYAHQSFVQNDDQPGIGIGATVAIVRDGGQQRVVPIDPSVGARIANDERQGNERRPSYDNDRREGYGRQGDERRQPYDNNQREGYGRQEDQGNSSRYVRDEGYPSENTQEVQSTIRRNYRP